ncbi:MAG: class F sortase [Candidatus Paceibacterota bacterium]|jgi:LPXTG-site transpeptidase (sortase) family protein
MNLQTKKTLVRVLIIAAVLIFGFILLRAFYYAPNDEVQISPEAVEPLSNEAIAIKSFSGTPGKLSIPKIKVETKIQEVGVTNKGNMAAPNNFVDVGWYKYGTIPGNVGSAVIAGHVNNGIALPAVFSNLKDLVEGDDIYITNDTGETLHFKVTGSKIYDYNAKADEVFAGDDSRTLRLITCSGVWVKEFRTHNKRLVVSAVLSE